MSRAKITAYLPPDVAETLRRVAAINDRSLSDIVEDAILQHIGDAGRAAEHAALIARLDQLGRQLRRIEAAQETSFELAAQLARYTLSVAPELPEADLPFLEARGNERLRNILAIVVARLAAGRSVGRDLAARLTPEAGPRPGRGAGPRADAPVPDSAE